MFFFIAYRTNNTLQSLWLNGNQIGDAGAASIGDALTYVVFFLLGGNLFFCHATRFFGKILGQYFLKKIHVFFHRIQNEQDVANADPQQKPNWRRGCCFDR